MKLRYLPIIAAMGFLASSCATQTASRGSSTDDIYFSTEDAQASTITTETTTTTNTSDTYTTYPGNSEKVDYNQPSGSDADYRTGSEDLSSETYYDDEGNTYVVNNYYEDDNYGYDDYDDYYYTTNIYRYYYPYSGFGYYSHCYSPYYYNPYGWNISFGWGYGSCYPYGYYNPWSCHNYGYYGYYDPWYSPYYGYGYGYGGYGNGYYNGYYDGYYNGYYDGYYGSGYGNDGYYGYSDNGYYYGPNTSTGSNTNTGSSSVDMIAAGYDKTGNTDLNHILTDKGTLEVNKGDVNINAASSDNGTTIGSPEFTSIKGVTAKDEVAGLNNDAVAINNEKPITTGQNATKESGSVKVIKYYSAADAPVKNTISENVTSPVVKTDRGIIRSNDNNYSVSKPSANYQPKGGGPVKPAADAPIQKQNYQQKQNNSNNPQVKPQYNGIPENKNTYDQPSRPDSNPSKNYEQPVKKNTYEAPKTNSGSSGKSTYGNSGSSPKSSGSYSSGSSGSRPSSSGSSSSPKKRSGGK